MSRQAKVRRFVPRVSLLEARRLLSATIHSITQDGDYTGPGPSFGPDDITDIDIALTSLSGTIDHVDVTSSNQDGQTLHWESGVNLNGYNNAEVIPESDGYTHVYVNSMTQPYPVNQPTTGSGAAGVEIATSNPQFTVTVTYTAGSPDVASGTGYFATSFTPNSATSPYNGQTPWNINATMTSQDTLAGSGVSRIQFASPIPSSDGTLQWAVLSDEAGKYWTYTAPSQPLSPPQANGLQLAADPTGYSYFSFVPTRNEAGSVLTLQVKYSASSPIFVRILGTQSDPNAVNPVTLVNDPDPVPGPTGSIESGTASTDLNVWLANESFNSPLNYSRSVRRALSYR